MLVGFGFALLLLATSPGLPMAWDEGDALDRADRIARWTHRWHPEAMRVAGPLSEEVIAADWPHTTVREGHPAFYGVVIAVGRAVSARWLGPVESARFGPILLFGLAVAAMFGRLAKEESTITAAGAVLALCLLPRMFAHAHFASFDGPLVSGWILTWATFPTARAGQRGVVPWGAMLWGTVLGMTLATKATGWLAPVPFVVWAICYRDRAAVRALAVGIPVALVVFVLLNPPLWHHPIQGTATFLHLNLHRADQPEINISTWFLGHMHNLHDPLPWYNTLFWTAVTVPVGLLGLMAVGLVSVLRRCRPHPAGMLVVFHAAVLLVVRALPGAPPHDGVRLFLPAFAMLAVLAGIGCSAVVGFWAVEGSAGSSAARPSTLPDRRRLAIAGVLLIYLGSATSLFWYRPQWLSYYNLLIGGLPGATASGMEPTYYWDGLDRSVLDWLEANTQAGEKVHFAAGSPENLEWLRRWGMLTVEFRPTAAGSYRWYVLQRRPSAWQPHDRWLIEHAEPAFQKTVRAAGRGPWRLDVPVVEVYSIEQYPRRPVDLASDEP